MEVHPTLTNGGGNKDKAEEGHGGSLMETRKGNRWFELSALKSLRDAQKWPGLPP
jgi:hypothetical protein